MAWKLTCESLLCMLSLYNETIWKQKSLNMWYCDNSVSTFLLFIFFCVNVCIVMDISLERERIVMQCVCDNFINIVSMQHLVLTHESLQFLILKSHTQLHTVEVCQFFFIYLIWNFLTPPKPLKMSKTHFFTQNRSDNDSSNKKKVKFIPL